MPRGRRTGWSSDKATMTRDPPRCSAPSHSSGSTAVRKSSRRRADGPRAQPPPGTQPTISRPEEAGWSARRALSSSSCALPGVPGGPGTLPRPFTGAHCRQGPEAVPAQAVAAPGGPAYLARPWRGEEPVSSGGLLLQITAVRVLLLEFGDDGEMIRRPDVVHWGGAGQPGGSHAAPALPGRADQDVVDPRIGDH